MANSQSITNKYTNVSFKIIFLHKICHNSDMFRSILIIFRELLSFSKAYIKHGGVIKYIKNINLFNNPSMFCICFTEVK